MLGQVSCVVSHRNGYRAARLQGDARRGRVHGELAEGYEKAADQTPLIENLHITN